MSDHIPDPVKMVSARDVPRIDVEVFALPLKDRLVIARALVPECAVVPREPTEMNAACYRAMLAASEPTR